MNIKGLFNDLMGESKTAEGSGSNFNMKGAAIGGIGALLLSSKKARKVAGATAKIGGAALLGGLAYSAVTNWQKSKRRAHVAHSGNEDIGEYESADLKLKQKSDYTDRVMNDESFQLLLIRAMIAAAKADGHLDRTEQRRIFSVIDGMQTDTDYKEMIIELVQENLTIEEVASQAVGIEEKSEVYLMSCFAIDENQRTCRDYLQRLQRRLGLPEPLAAQLRAQSRNPQWEAA